MSEGFELLQALPAAVYATDADGRITFFNEAAAELWGRRPAIGDARWCGSWRLYWPDGQPMRHDECPMAVTLREGRPCLGREAVAERPDGSRVTFMPYPAPVKDAAGRVTGGINLLADISALKEAEVAAARLAAIVSCSDDAIVSKTLDGTVVTWNEGAERLFGYAPEEMIGRSIKRIIPPELQAEEDEILRRLSAGERIDHFDTVRLAKDGSRVEVSLTVSPVRDTAGTIVGASKVAREIGERKRHEAMQRLLLEELNHRVKNTLAIIQSLASQTVRRTASPQAFVDSFSGRVRALARAHDLLVEREMKGATLGELVHRQVGLGAPADSRISCSGPEVMFESRLAVQMALVLHELATNARKYGALSVPGGRLSIAWAVGGAGEPRLSLSWQESGGPGVTAPEGHGFGARLIEHSLKANGGKLSWRFAPGGLNCRIVLPLPEGAVSSPGRDRRDGARRTAPADAGAGSDVVRGARVLVVEDEPLVAMHVEAELEALGAAVVGPASSVAAAERLIETAAFDVALVDGNLQGQPADRIAAALALKGVPFAFATGYGPDALPRDFRHVPILSKPLQPSELKRTLAGLLDDRARRPMPAADASGAEVRTDTPLREDAPTT